MFIVVEIGMSWSLENKEPCGKGILLVREVVSSRDLEKVG